MKLKREKGSVSILVIGILIGVCSLMLMLAAIGGGFVAHAELQQAVDIAAVSVKAGGDIPAARVGRIVKQNGADKVVVSEVNDGEKLRITAWRRGPDIPTVSNGIMLKVERLVEVPQFKDNDFVFRSGEYKGKLVAVKGVQVCPKVADAFIRLDHEANRAGVYLQPNSGFRSFAEQAILYKQLGARLAAPPGVSRHHDATELDINVGSSGSAIHRWLSGNAMRFGFMQRYSWEPWHWGYVMGC